MPTPSFPENFGQIPYNDENKQRFLKAGKELLTAVGRALQQQGLVEDFRVSVNRAGIAVAGDVYLDLVMRNAPHLGGLVTLTDGVGSPSSRPDHIICYGQHRSMPNTAVPGEKTRLTRIVGDNRFIKGAISFDSVADLARTLVEHHPERGQQPPSRQDEAGPAL